MDPNNKKDQKNNQNRNRNMRGVVTLIIWALVLTVVFNYINAYSNNLTKRASSHEIPYSQLIDLIQEDQVAELKIENGVLYATPVDGYVYTEEAADKNKEPKSYTQSEKTPLILYTTALNDASLLPLLEEHNVKYTSPVQTQMSPILEFMITYVLPMIVLVALFMLVMRIMAKNGGGIGGIGSVGKSNAKVYMEKSTGVTFKDVAGQDEAKESLEEIIDFLHNPQKYTAIGARLPKGALLVGSPGTGKTLLAKAVAGEANVPFFSISGSDFVEMFVGVGASRVRDLFKEAAKVAPCIIFIDEIDTIGKSRDGGRFGGGNDEREQTLNQLLAELDGFDPGKGIIVLGATNRPEVLDKALLRPGRFDRRITVDRPNLAGRLATLQVHTRNIHLAEDVNLEKIAQATAGCVGADLANLVNEAAQPHGPQGRLVDKVRQICAHAAGGGLSDLLQIHILGQMDVPGVDLQGGQTARQIGTVHGDAPVEAAGTQQGLVQHLRAVGGAQNDDALAGIEAVQLRQQLVQGLLPLVVAAAKRSPSRDLPMVSISSMKMMQGATLAASLNRSRTREAPTPTNISTKSEPEMEKKGTLASPATALASSVLPVPGGPTSRAPLGSLRRSPCTSGGCGGSR